MADSDLPPLVWVKAQAPGFHADGSTMATFNLATVLAGYFSLHLVCLNTSITDATVTDRCCPPFTSAVVVTADHQRSKLHRAAFGAWYFAHEKLRVRPRAQSIESCRAFVRGIQDRVRSTGAAVALGEYWTVGPAVASSGANHTVLRLHDVAHENEQASPNPAGKQAINAAGLIRKAELKAANAASETLYVSNEDRRIFERLGVSNGRVIPLHVPFDSKPPDSKNHVKRPSGPVLLFLGHLDWWPNRQGLQWFLDHVFPGVLAKHPTVRLDVVGAGDIDGITVNSPRVRLLGFVDDLESTLRLATIGIVPITAGTGVKTKTLKMLAAGLPVVSTTSGLRGTSGVTGGALVAESATSFASAINSLLEDDELRQGVIDQGQSSLATMHSEDAARAFAEDLVAISGGL